MKTVFLNFFVIIPALNYSTSPYTDCFLRKSEEKTCKENENLWKVALISKSHALYTFNKWFAMHSQLYKIFKPRFQGNGIEIEIDHVNIPEDELVDLSLVDGQTYIIHSAREAAAKVLVDEGWRDPLPPPPPVAPAGTLMA